MSEKLLEDVIKTAVQDSSSPGHTTVRKMAETTQPILGTRNEQQLVYCVAIAPDEVDTDGETMAARDIEYAAHRFMTHSRIVKSMHSHAISAVPVESYIAPTDLHFGDSGHGEQVVQKGSWVLGIRINDPEQWAKVRDGQYTGISVGGFGLRGEA